MDSKNVKDVEGIKVSQIGYKGKNQEVKGVTIRWLSKSGKDANGQPEYGLRHFTIEPGGEIPAHNHFYLQTVYIEKGQFECFAYNPETDEITESKICGPGDFVFSDCMEPHGMRNISETEDATFLCCIGCVYEKESN